MEDFEAEGWERVSTMARRKGVSTVSIYDWIKSGKVESRKILGLLIVRERSESNEDRNLDAR